MNSPTDQVATKEVTQSTVAVQQTEAEPQNPAEVNWKNFREARKREREEKLQLERKTQEQESQMAAMKAAMESMIKPQTESVELSDDDILNQKVAKALQAERDRFTTEQRLKEQQELPYKIRSVFPDFEQVCSQENMDYLDYHYPEVSKALESMPDGFEKYATIYKAAKRFLPNTNAQKEVDKAKANLSKPQSISKVGSDASITEDSRRYLDDKRRSDNWLRMQKIMRGS